MSRIIKFRVWYAFKKEMLPVTSLEFRDGELSRIVADVEDVLDFTPDEDVLMQFTGLLDKNKHEIYEDDLLVHRYPAGESVYRVAIGQFTHDIEGMDFSYVGVHLLPLYNTYESLIDTITTGIEWPVASVEMEIIGNVHANPELARLRDVA